MSERRDPVMPDYDDGRWKNPDWYSTIERPLRMAITSRAALRTISTYYGLRKVELGDDLIQLFYLNLISASQTVEDTEPTIYIRPQDLADDRATDPYVAGDVTLRAAIEASFECIITSAEATDFDQSGWKAAATACKKSLESAVYLENHGQVGNATALDVRMTRKGHDLIRFPLWHDIQISPKASSFHEALSADLAKDENCDFWRRYYLGMWNGSFQEWDLAEEIISIPLEDWNEGYKHLAKLISGIEARHLSERAPLAEDVSFDEVLKKFKVVPIPLNNPAFISSVIHRIEDALDDSLSGNNGLRPDESVVRKLRRANSHYANDPQRLELDYTSAAHSLRRLFDSKELSKTEDNHDLQNAVEDGVRALRANHPEVAENRAQLAKQKINETSEDALALLEDAQPLLIALSSDVMAKDFAQDIPRLINDATSPLPSGVPPLPGADEATRIFSRVSRMKLIYDKMTEQGANVFDSKEFKTARLGLTVGRMFRALVSFGVGLIGVI